jgi:hypothetical protein
MAWLIERERTGLSRIIRCSGLPRTKPDHRQHPIDNPKRRSLPASKTTPYTELSCG